MTTLPIPRYTGANTFTAQDYAGNVFYAYQSTSKDDVGVLVMIDPAGIAHNITPAIVGGRPCLDCNPGVGLWFVGNKETGSTQPPARYQVKEYVPWPAGAQGAQGEPGPAGAGGVTLYPAPVSSSAWNGRALNGGVLIDVPAVFGVESLPAYLVRLCGQAASANVKVRAGVETAPYFLTLTTQAPNVRFDAQGWVPGPLLFVSTVDGLAQVWLQIVGRS